MMNGFSLVLVLMFATAAVLFAGLVVMLKGGKLNEKYGNKLMVARVAFQALTIALLAALFFVRK